MNPEQIEQLQTIREIDAARAEAVTALQTAQANAAARHAPDDVTALQLKELNVRIAALKAGLTSAEMAAALGVIKTQSANMKTTAGTLPAVGGALGKVNTLLGQADTLIGVIQNGVG